MKTKTTKTNSCMCTCNLLSSSHNCCDVIDTVKKVSSEIEKSVVCLLPLIKCSKEKLFIANETEFMFDIQVKCQYFMKSINICSFRGPFNMVDS